MKIKRVILLVVTTLLLASCGNHESKQPVQESKTETVETDLGEPGSPETEVLEPESSQTEETETVVPESQEPSSEPESEPQTEEALKQEETEPVKESEAVKEPESEETNSSEPGSPESQEPESEPEPVVPESKEPEQTKEPEVHTHNYVLASETAANCVNEGMKTYKCSCGDSYTENVAKTGHNYVTESKAATCTSDGYTKKYCAGCGHVESETVLNATGQHSYNGTVTTAASCSAEGVMTYSCSGCGNSYTESIPATDHFKVESAREQYCKEEGWIKYVCAYCGAESTETLAPLGGEHAWVESWYIAPTCHSGGAGHGQHCSKCDGYVNLPESEPLGCVADAGTVYLESTCSWTGEMAHNCVRCGSTMPHTVIPIDPNAHDWSWDEEYHEWYCSNGCGAIK